MKSSWFSPGTWGRISSHLDRALDLQTGEREAWLSQLASTQPDIAETLRGALAELEAADTSGVLRSRPPALIAMESGSRHSMIGRRIGAYRIERLIGRGGMGEVWLASRSDGRFEGECAIKLLDDSAFPRTLVTRFRREGRLLARLTHPNIARLLDAGATEEGRHYLVLEYVDGERIDDYCNGMALDIVERIRLLVEVVSAVAHAHSNCIVHRDLKPSNVLVTREGVAKLLDFGIAKLSSSDSCDHPDNTRWEDALLTPEYAAPEQLLRETPSTATDVYQLGVLLYTVLTGRHPLQSFGTRAERIEAALNGQIPRASEVCDRAVQKALRGDLDAILAMALRKEPRERYATAAALHEDLVRFLNREPVSARKGAALYRTRKFVARHRIAATAVGLALGGFCIALAFSIAQTLESARQRDKAVAEANRAQAHAHFTTLIMSAIGEPGRPVSPEGVLDIGVKLLESQYAENPDFAVKELIHISGRYMDWGYRQREYDVLRRAESIARESADSLQLARVQCNTVEAEIALGRLDRAIARLAEGRRALAQAHGAQVGDEADCLSAAAHVSHAQGRIQDAIRDLGRAVALLKRSGMTAGVRYAALLSFIGEMYRAQGDFKKTYEYVREARIAKERHGYGGTVGWNAVLHNEAAALRDLGEVRTALQQELEVLRRLDGQNGSSPLNPAVSLVYAGMLARVDDHTEALCWVDRAVMDARATADRNAELNAHAARASLLLSLGRAEEAAAELRIVDDAVGSSTIEFRHTHTRALLVRVDLLLAQGNFNEARQLADALVMRSRDPGLGLSLYLDAALLAASRAALRNDPAAAEAFAQEALRIDEHRARDPEQSADVGEASLVLAQARLARGDWGGARSAVDRASQVLTRALGASHSLTVTAAAVRAEADRSERTGRITADVRAGAI
jgi:eukaryotic-like serine/threonine-protein kinase